MQSLLCLCLPTVKIENKQSYACKSSVSCGPSKAIHVNLIWEVAADFKRELVLLQWVETLANTLLQDPA